MGFIDTSTDPQLPIFYNVVHAVGKNCPNLRDDVKLVQYLLKSIYDKYPAHHRPNGTMTVDGVCGVALSAGFGFAFSGIWQIIFAKPNHLVLWLTVFAGLLINISIFIIRAF